MALSVFAAPILPDKVEAWRRLTQEMLESRRREYEESRRRLGISRELAFLQQTPQGPLALIYWEAAQPEGVLQQIAASDYPFDRWFREQLLEIHGLDVAQIPPGSPAEVTLEWHAAFEQVT